MKRTAACTVREAVSISEAVFIWREYSYSICLHVRSLSRVWLFATPWTVAHQAPLSMGFPSKNTGVGCHFLLQEIFPAQGSNHVSCIAGRFFTLLFGRSHSERFGLGLSLADLVSRFPAADWKIEEEREKTNRQAHSAAKLPTWQRRKRAKAGLNEWMNELRLNDLEAS